MGFIKKAAVATALATAVVAMVGQGGAFALGGASAVGMGTIAPGLTTSCPPWSQTSVTFDSFVLVYADAARLSVNAGGSTHFSGASVGCETVQKGQGAGTVSGGLAGTITYQRTASLVTLGGTINGGAILAGACIFVPTSWNPTTTFALACVAATS